MNVRVGLQVVDGTDDLRQSHAFGIGVGRRRMDIALHSDSRIQRGREARDAQHVAIAHEWRGRVASGGDIDGHHHPIFLVIDAGERGFARIGFRRETAGQVDRVRGRRSALHFIDCRAMHLAAHRNGGTDRGHEHDVAWQQLRIVRGVAAQEHVVQIEGPDHLTLALELNAAQGADRLHAARGEQRGRDAPKTADRVRARPARLSEHKHANRSRVAHRHVGAHPDHLARDAFFEALLHCREALAAHADRTQLGEAHAAIAAHDERYRAVLVAVQLHVKLIASTHDVVRRHRHVRDRREGGRRALEQVVAERLERIRAEFLQRQANERNIKIAQLRIRLQPNCRFELRQAGERNAREPGEQQLPFR